MRCFLGNAPEGQALLCNFKAKGVKNMLLLCRGNKIIHIFYRYFEDRYLLSMNQFQMVGTAFHVDRDNLLLSSAFFC